LSDFGGQSDAKLCPDCQQVYGDTDRQCSHCGREFAASTSQQKRVYLAAAIAFACAGLALLARWRVLPSSLEVVFIGLGHLGFGVVAMKAMRRVAADNWAAAGAIRRIWLAFAVSITVLMAIAGAGTLILIMLALSFGF